MLSRYYGKKVIILLDEYDTPAQDAYLNGYWEDFVRRFRGLCISTFKSNEYLERGIITGVTRISKESVFSGLNNLDVVTMTSDDYADAFGFTEKEVFLAMDEMGLDDRKSVREWYDGYVIGEKKGIYNPWSVINFLRKKKFNAYWANTSNNSLISELICKGSSEIKSHMERLLQKKSITVPIDEEVVFSQLDVDEDAVWSLLLASGYLKVVGVNRAGYEMEIVNREVFEMFLKLIRLWFHREKASFTGCLEALMSGDVETMNEKMNKVTESAFSYFDISGNQPEKFYHGFVLGILVDLGEEYVLSSNRESGDGRYDIMLEPRDRGKDAIIIEFKVVKKNQSLESTVESALQQIEEKKYEQDLIARGFAKEKIRKYGFAFQGKTVLIG